MVLFWVGNCIVTKNSKNEILLCKPDALRLGKGQVSTFWLMSLHLGKGLARLREPETCLLTISSFA